MWIGLLVLFIAQMIGGAIGPTVVKLGTREFPPLLFTELRMILATILFLPFFLKTKNRNLKHSDYFRLGILAFCLFINVSFFSIAMQYTSVIMSQIIYVAVPVVVAVASHFILQERLVKRYIIGLFIAVCGILFLFFQSIIMQNQLSFGSPLGNFLLLLAMMGYSGYIIVSRRLTKRYSSATLTFFTFALISLYLLLFLPFEYKIRPFNIHHITFFGMEMLFTNAIFPTILLYFFIQIGVRYTNAFIVSLFQYLAPFWATLAGIFIFGEKPTVTFLFGGICIIAGVFYATTYEQVKEYVTGMLQ